MQLKLEENTAGNKCKILWMLMKENAHVPRSLVANRALELSLLLVPVRIKSSLDSSKFGYFP